MIPVIYERDVNGIIESDFVIAVLNGVQVDDGTAFEIGYAKALGKKIVAYRDDFRTPCKESPFVDFNIMIDQSIIKPVAHSLDELVCIIKDNFKV